jgi:AGZA family xanthine/uracil permease-like MFS transporter
MALAIERRFVQAAAWMSAAALFSCFGVIHAYTLTSAGIEGRVGWFAAPAFAVSYGAGTVFLLLCARYNRITQQGISTLTI